MRLMRRKKKQDLRDEDGYYDGDMNYYQRQVARKGYTVEEIDMINYCGATARELQGIVDSLPDKKKGEEP